MTETTTPLVEQVTRRDNKERRSISFRVVVEERSDYQVGLNLTIQHHRGGQYLATLWRESISHGFTTVSIHEDRGFGILLERGGSRYSWKHLTEIANEYQSDLATLIQAHLDWALAMPKR